MPDLKSPFLAEFSLNFKYHSACWAGCWQPSAETSTGILPASGVLTDAGHSRLLGLDFQTTYRR